jgi:predicted secreted protein
MRKKESSKSSFNFNLMTKQKSHIDIADLRNINQEDEAENNFRGLKLVKNKSVAMSKSSVGITQTPSSPKKREKRTTYVEQMIDSSNSSVSSTENDLHALKQKKMDDIEAISLRKITADFTSYSISQQAQMDGKLVIKFPTEEEVKAAISSRSISEDLGARI